VGDNISKHDLIEAIIGAVGWNSGGAKSFDRPGRI